MSIILFNYSGSINNQSIMGNGSLCSNADNGQFIGSIIFSDFPSTFNPGAVGVSLLSISCVNKGFSAYGIPNILSLSTGQYKSKRTVDFKSNTGNPLGQVIIDGTFTKKDDEIYQADVIVSGTYTGPTDLILPFGYDLPLNVINPTKLQGSFNLNVEIVSGSYIQTTHTHEYEFIGGTTQPLQDCESQIYYGPNPNWNSTNKSLYLPGVAIMRNQ